MKIGVDVYRYQANSFFDSSIRGLYTFTDWAGFATGSPTAYTQNFGSSVRGSRIWNDNYFAQDDRKVSRRLTLNIGTRFEQAHGTKEVNGISSNLDLGCRDSRRGRHGAAWVFRAGRAFQQDACELGPQAWFCLDGG